VALWIISVVVVISMVCSYTVILRPPREAATPTPTLFATAAPRPSDTPPPRTATPEPSDTPTPEAATPQPSDTPTRGAATPLAQGTSSTATPTMYVSDC